MSDTPKTDSFELNYATTGGGWGRPFSFARELERTIATQAETIRRISADLEARINDLTDTLDMMRDEFQRIVACPGCNAEIEDLANRAQLKLIQHVPVIVQRDNAEAEASRARVRVSELEKDKARLDWMIDTIVQRGMRGLRAAMVQHNEREEPILDRAAIDAAKKTTS